MGIKIILYLINITFYILFQSIPVWACRIFKKKSKFIKFCAQGFAGLHKLWQWSQWMKSFSSNQIVLGVTLGSGVLLKQDRKCVILWGIVIHLLEYRTSRSLNLVYNTHPNEAESCKSDFLHKNIFFKKVNKKKNQSNCFWTPLHVKRPLQILKPNDVVHSRDIITFLVKRRLADLAASCDVDFCASLNPLAACGSFVMDCKPWCRHIVLPRQPHPPYLQAMLQHCTLLVLHALLPSLAWPFLLWSALHWALALLSCFSNAQITFSLQSEQQSRPAFGS